jgi:tRNA nucleotidyltransferase (CCA-adding enzyme)
MQLKIADPQVESAVMTICTLVRIAGGRALAVGGGVRDAALHVPAADVDIEVFGVPADALERLLVAAFRVDRVGQAFGVLKIHGLPVDVSLPRREAKAGTGHSGFIVASDPGMSTAEAALRRDFTINAVSLDPLTGQVIDPCGGLDDLRRGILRHTSGSYTEDPQRVLRGKQ